jgi:hypothetical protein
MIKRQKLPIIKKQLLIYTFFSLGRPIMTGQDLRQLLLDKWGRSYDIQLRRIKGQIFVQVMWKYREQASFPLSEAEYVAHLNAIADYLQAWGGVSQVKNYLEKTRDHPRLGKAVSIPLDLGERASEWILE